MTDIVAELRARTICVPKPGTEPFTPTQPFWTESDCAHHAAGEPAGFQYLPALFGATPRVQEHVWITEPLCERAAVEIERLTRELAEVQRMRNAELYPQPAEAKDAVRCAFEGCHNLIAAHYIGNTRWCAIHIPRGERA